MLSYCCMPEYVDESLNLSFEFPVSSFCWNLGGSITGGNLSAPLEQHKEKDAVGELPYSLPSCFSSLNISAPHCTHEKFICLMSPYFTVDSSKVSKPCLPKNSFCIFKILLCSFSFAQALFCLSAFFLLHSQQFFLILIIPCLPLSCYILLFGPK